MSDPITVDYPVVTTSVEETISIGEKLGQELKSGDVVALLGDLGTGKTHFVKGICSSFGVPEEVVSSPTFTVIKEYEADPMIYHLDLYRIKTLAEAVALGVEEYLESDGICLIEWPELIGSLLPSSMVTIRISHREGNTRYIERSRA